MVGSPERLTRRNFLKKAAVTTAGLFLDFKGLSKALKNEKEEISSKNIKSPFEILEDCEKETLRVIFDRYLFCLVTNRKTTPKNYLAQVWDFNNKNEKLFEKIRNIYELRNVHNPDKKLTTKEKHEFAKNLLIASSVLLNNPKELEEKIVEIQKLYVMPEGQLKNFNLAISKLYIVKYDKFNEKGEQYVKIFSELGIPLFESEPKEERLYKSDSQKSTLLERIFQNKNKEEVNHTHTYTSTAPSEKIEDHAAYSTKNGPKSISISSSGNGPLMISDTDMHTLSAGVFDFLLFIYKKTISYYKS